MLNSAQIVGEGKSSEQVTALAGVLRGLAIDAATARAGSIDLAALGTGQTETPWGDVNAILSRGAETEGERAVADGLLALGFAEQPNLAVQHAADLVWLATHHQWDAFAALTPACGDAAAPVWQAVSALAQAPGGAGLGRPEALVAAAIVAREPSARAALDELAGADDPLVRAMATTPDASAAGALSGHLIPAPRHAVWTVVLALTTLLFWLYLGRLIARFALGMKRPATLKVTAQGVEVQHRTLLLGRVIRERHTVVPLSGVRRVTREVRYARIGLYAGLATLVLGTYLGMGLFVDGIRVGSPAWLALGFLLMLIGIGIDFALNSFADTARGTCRLVVVPEKGKALCVSQLDQRGADAMLSEVASRAAPPS